jgi:hypothetical protein
MVFWPAGTEIQFLVSCTFKPGARSQPILLRKVRTAAYIRTTNSPPADRRCSRRQPWRWPMAFNINKKR